MHSIAFFLTKSSKIQMLAKVFSSSVGHLVRNCPYRPRSANCSSFHADQRKDCRNEAACINFDLSNHNKGTRGTRYISIHQLFHPDCPVNKETYALERHQSLQQSIWKDRQKICSTIASS